MCLPKKTLPSRHFSGGGYHRLIKVFKTKQLLFAWLLIFRAYHTKFIKHICQTTTNNKKKKNTHIISPLIISYNLAHSLNILKFANWPKWKGKQWKSEEEKKPLTPQGRTKQQKKSEIFLTNAYIRYSLAIFSMKRCRVERKKICICTYSSDKQVAAAGTEQFGQIICEREKNLINKYAMV